VIRRLTCWQWPADLPTIVGKLTRATSPRDLSGVPGGGRTVHLDLLLAPTRPHLLMAAPERAGSRAAAGRLPELLDQLEAARGPADPVPSADGWRLVLAENIGYLVDADRRWQAVAELERLVGLAPEDIVAAPDAVLRGIVIGMSPEQRVARLRRCAELAVAGAPWTAYPGIGRPGAERIDLFTGTKAVLALETGGLRVLTRLGYGAPDRSYAASYRQAQIAASAELPSLAPALVRAHQLLRRHGREVCTRKDPACPQCPLAASCPSAGQASPMY
jgi:hypothetical protein